ncbi:MAG: methionyl-tRNA formyltransferase [Alphaproteobacteria bacterium]|nr:methionyl-tRNA formyltransferase [Alphaproteobacteria bacterium]
MRIIFMGTPEFSVAALAELINAGHDIAAVYTQPPRPAGRGMAERPSPVHAFAIEQGLDVRHPKSLKGADEQEAFRALDADAAVVVAYGLILPKAILQAPREGCFNIHASHLPRWRGAAPIQRAIMAGDTSTAVMIMRMEEGLDTGPVCLGEMLPIGPDMTASQLHDGLSEAGAGLIVRALAALERGSLNATPQPVEGVSYAAKIEKAEARIDFREAAADVHNKIRGLSPFPGAWFEIEVGEKRERVKALMSRQAETDKSGAAGEVLEANGRLIIACGSGAVELLNVQRAGKKACSAADFLRGCAIEPGTVLPFE